MTLSSKLPAAPATVMATSLPMTCAQAIRVASGTTGLTLPGMMLDPGCRSGRWISPSPVRGPELIQRRSLQIFVRLTATTLRAPDSSTTASWADCASKWSTASRKGSPVVSATRAMTAAAKPGAALRPVPAAVPPRGSSAVAAAAALTRPAPSST